MKPLTPCWLWWKCFSTAQQGKVKGINEVLEVCWFVATTVDCHLPLGIKQLTMAVSVFFQQYLKLIHWPNIHNNSLLLVRQWETFIMKQQQDTFGLHQQITQLWYDWMPSANIKIRLSVWARNSTKIQLHVTKVLTAVHSETFKSRAFSLSAQPRVELTTQLVERRRHGWVVVMVSYSARPQQCDFARISAALRTHWRHKCSWLGMALCN